MPQLPRVIFDLRKNYFSNHMVMRDSKVTIFFLLVWAMTATLFCIYSSYTTNFCPYKWHGGSPHFKGSCWCGGDSYCMCTPSLAIDAVIEVPGADENDIRIVLVHRRDPPKHIYAIPGGFVDIGESVEAATIREVKEETNLVVDTLEQFHVYSDPKRDSRRHTVSSVFRCRVHDIIQLHRGDDAESVEAISIRKVLQLPLAFDHHQVLSDYIAHFHPNIAKELGLPSKLIFVEKAIHA